MPRSLSRRTFVGIAASVVLVLPRLALAADDNSTPDKALPFGASQSASLGGGPGGRFAYYKFASPGGWPVRIEMSPNRNLDDKSFLRAVGFKVYGPDPNKVYVEGKLDDGGIWQGGADLTSQDQGAYLIQVYNYNPNYDAVMNYTLTGSNIPAQPGEPDAPASQAPEAGEFGYTAIPLKGVQTGELDAGSAGRFRYYKFKAGAGSTIGVDMQVFPDDSGILQLAGFKLYGPTNGKEYLQSEARRGKTPNQAGELYVTENGLYVLQVYNYAPSTPISYRVSTRGPTWLD